MKIRYIGNFPPPYGGVTIKNQLLWESLSRHLSIDRLKESERMPKRLYKFCNMLLAVTSRKPLIIGISAAGGKSRLLTRLLYTFNRRIMKQSLYFMMGGLEAGRIAANPTEIQWYQNYRKIYVETASMAKCLEEAGLKNAGCFPNCRQKPEQKMRISENRDRPLKCVFFSLIQPMKGAEDIFAAAEKLPQVEFTFWGHISPEYQDAFLGRIQNCANVRYLGVFRGSNGEVYAELSKYDVLLLPTKMTTEGVPGILAEAKISGIPSIVSNLCYNAEIVAHGVSGIVLGENTAEALTEAIACYDGDRDLLSRHKEGALHSAEAYYVENYLEEIIHCIKESF